MRCYSCAGAGQASARVSKTHWGEAECVHLPTGQTRVTALRQKHYFRNFLPAPSAACDCCFLPLERETSSVFAPFLAFARRN